MSNLVIVSYEYPAWGVSNNKDADDLVSLLASKEYPVRFDEVIASEEKQAVKLQNSYLQALVQPLMPRFTSKFLNAEEFTPNDTGSVFLDIVASPETNAYIEEYLIPTAAKRDTLVIASHIAACGIGECISFTRGINVAAEDFANPLLLQFELEEAALPA